MAYHKIEETPLTKGRYYKNKRLYIKSSCEVCKSEREIRYDHYREKFLKLGKPLRCRNCSKIKYGGYTQKYGYVIRHYRSYDEKHWHILKKMCKSNGQIKEHRANKAIEIGRALKRNEIVHHKNGIRNDNRLHNLELCLIRQPVGQREKDLIEENRRLHDIINRHNICLSEN